MLRRLIHADVERTVHRLQAKLDLFQFRRRKHYVRVVLFVTTDAPQLTLSNMRRVNQSITALLKFRAQIIFHLRPDRAALRMPEHEALSVVFLNRKQIKLAAESSMVTLLSFLTLFQPTVEFSLSEERRAVDALHLRTLRIAFPVSAGQRQKLESFQAIRIRHVRAEPEIDERRTVDVIDAEVSASLLVD